ncbi:MAG: M67 family metallopeptidase [Saprospiraceae bacterium]
MIHIEPNIEQLMLDDARQAFPDECCGFLFGKEKGENRVLTDILVVNNSKEGDKRRRFEIAPKDYLKAERYADKSGQTLLAVYHSHPNHPAIPSEHDRVAAQPFFSYLIVSVQDGKIDHTRSWRLNDDRQFEEEIINELVVDEG